VIVEHVVTPVTIERLARLSIAFEVREVLDLAALRGGDVRARPVGQPWVKDYAVDHPPTGWLERFETAQWRLLADEEEDRWLGAAVLIQGDPAIDLLEGRADRALLWDLRVAPEHRRAGVGRRLWGAAERWARHAGASELVVETQDINVPACRFYRRQGCDVLRVDPNAYPEHPGEVQVLWRRRL
jgi:GNAT superfamily N-acetyltransferase